MLSLGRGAIRLSVRLPVYKVVSWSGQRTSQTPNITLKPPDSESFLEGSQLSSTNVAKTAKKYAGEKDFHLNAAYIDMQVGSRKIVIKRKTQTGVDKGD